MNYRIVNARIVNEARTVDGDLSIADGRIVGVNAAEPANAEVIDAQGA